MKRFCSAVVWVTFLFTFASGQDAGKPDSGLLRTSLHKLPIYFIVNQGVFPAEVAFYVQGADKTLFFTKTGITFRLKGQDRGWVVKLEFVGANPDVKPECRDRQQAVFSYFRGPEKEWKTGLPSYAEIRY